MRSVVEKSLRDNIAAAVAFAPVCFLVAVLSGASHRPDWLLLGAGELAFVWIVMLALAGVPVAPRVCLTLPARSRAWATAVWIQRVGMPFAVVAVVCLTYLLVLVLSGDHSQSRVRVALLALWTGLAVMVICSLEGYSGSNRSLRAPIWYAAPPALLVACWLAIEHGTKRAVPWNIELYGAAALCAVSLFLSFLLRHRMFMVAAGCLPSRTGVDSRQYAPRHFCRPGSLFGVIRSNPVPRILLFQLGYTTAFGVLMLWIGRGNPFAVILLTLMVGGSGGNQWVASWRAVIRVSASLPVGKPRVLLVSVVTTVLSVVVVFAAIVLLLLGQHLLIAPTQCGWGRYFSLQPLLLGVMLLFAAADTKNFASPYGRLLFGVPLAALTMGFSVFYLESPDMIGTLPVLCGGFLLAGIGVWLLVRGMRCVLDDSAFYRGKAT